LPPFFLCSFSVFCPPVKALETFCFISSFESNRNKDEPSDFDIFILPVNDGRNLKFRDDGGMNLNCFARAAISLVSLMWGSWSTPTGTIPGMGSSSWGWRMSATCKIEAIILAGSGFP